MEGRNSCPQSYLKVDVNASFQSNWETASEII